MSKIYYRVYYECSCHLETRWGESCDDELVIEDCVDYVEYEDGDTHFRNKRIRTILEKVGNCILADINGFHKGTKSKIGYRILVNNI